MHRTLGTIAPPKWSSSKSLSWHQLPDGFLTNAALPAVQSGQCQLHRPIPVRQQLACRAVHVPTGCTTQQQCTSSSRLPASCVQCTSSMSSGFISSLMHVSTLRPSSSQQANTAETRIATCCMNLPFDHTTGGGTTSRPCSQRLRSGAPSSSSTS